MQAKFNSPLVVTFLAAVCATTTIMAQTAGFHGAPPSASKMKNPYAGQSQASDAGGKLYSETCSKCHGQRGQGTGNIPALSTGPAQTVSDGEIFWFIIRDIANGMPSWKALPAQQRWQVKFPTNAAESVKNPNRDGNGAALPLPIKPRPHRHPLHLPIIDMRSPENSAKLPCRICPSLTFPNLPTMARIW